MDTQELQFTWMDDMLERISTAYINVGDLQTDKPVIILLHGTHGTIEDMRDPGAMPEPFNCQKIRDGTLVNRGWNWYPALGPIWGFTGGEPMTVTGWEPYLNAHGYPTINYSQVGPTETIQRPVAELRGLLQAVVEHRLFVDREIVLMGHSRGGIVARKVLVDLANDALASVPRAAKVLGAIKRLFMLHAPNRGSSLANQSIETNRVLMHRDLMLAAATMILIPFAGPVAAGVLWYLIDRVLDDIKKTVETPAFSDFAVGSPTLRSLASQEPVQGIEYYTWGGNNPRVFWFGAWIFTPLSVLPQPQWPPFNWETSFFGSLPVPPDLGGVLPKEMRYEVGDVLVTGVNAHLSFSQAITNPLNHAEALWDPIIQYQVVSILKHGEVRMGPPMVKHDVPAKLYISIILPDSSSDDDRTIDLYSGSDSNGIPWALTALEALELMNQGHRFFALTPHDRPVGVRAVKMRGSQRVYLRTAANGTVRLADLPRMKISIQTNRTNER